MQNLLIEYISVHVKFLEYTLSHKLNSQISISKHFKAFCGRGYDIQRAYRELPNSWSKKRKTKKTHPIKIDYICEYYIVFFICQI